MKSDETIDIYCVPLDASPARYEQYRLLLNHDEKARADRFRFDRDRIRWTSSRAALRLVLGRYMDLHAKDVCFHVQAGGKPEVCSSAAIVCDIPKTLDADDRVRPPLEFNLSHSRDVGIIAISQNLQVGSDVEYTGRINDWPAVSKRVFSETEQDELAGIDSDLQPLAFYLGWTRKEAVIKATGEGLRADLKAFDITLTPNQDATVVNDRRQTDSNAHWKLHHLTVGQDYVGAVAAISARPVRFIERTLKLAGDGSCDWSPLQGLET